MYLKLLSVVGLSCFFFPISSCLRLHHGLTYIAGRQLHWTLLAPAALWQSIFIPIFSSFPTGLWKLPLFPIFLMWWLFSKQNKGFNKCRYSPPHSVFILLILGMWICRWNQVFEARRLRTGDCGWRTFIYRLWYPHICGSRNHCRDRVRITD